MELRCDNHQLFGRVLYADDDKDKEHPILEVFCRNRLCGYGPGKVVLHYFDINANKMTDTKTFYDPQRLFLKGHKPKEETKCP